MRSGVGYRPAIIVISCLCLALGVLLVSFVVQDLPLPESMPDRIKSIQRVTYFKTAAIGAGGIAAGLGCLRWRVLEGIPAMAMLLVQFFWLASTIG